MGTSEIPGLVRRLYEIVDRLEQLFPGRRFTPDGHLVGSIGEVLAKHAYDLDLLPGSAERHDATAADGRNVQIKATQGRSVSLYDEPEFLLVLRLQRDGTFAEVYNGPGSAPWGDAGPRQKNGQRPISLSRLTALMDDVAPDQRIPVATDPAPEVGAADPEEIRRILLALASRIDRRELFPTMVPEASSIVFEDPFAFAMATCLDRGTLADIIWTIPYDMRNKLGHLDPSQLADMPESELDAVIRALPRKPRYLRDAARTVREIAVLVVREFDGDASRIWKGRLAAEVNRTFQRVHGVGPGIASMAVLLLERGFDIRFSDLDHRTMDIKPDVHTVRVLYRLGAAEAADETTAIAAARRLHPDYPGELDFPLWKLGREWCKARSPRCDACPMTDVCARVGA